MSEFVVGASPADPRAGFDRAGAILDRLGTRMTDQRSMETSFAVLVAAKDRYPIARVTRHVCRHDEGVGDCRSAVVEG